MQQYITLSPEQFNQFMANPPQQSLPPTTSIALGFNQTPTLINGANTYTLQGSLNDLLYSAGVSPFAMPRIEQMQAAVIPPVFYAPLPGMGGLGMTQFAQGSPTGASPQQAPMQGFGQQSFTA
jgi:hypothetical protein